LISGGAAPQINAGARALEVPVASAAALGADRSIHLKAAGTMIQGSGLFLAVLSETTVKIPTGQMIDYGLNLVPTTPKGPICQGILGNCLDNRRRKK
jgi:hypothetical protein